jgi:hypothetical protein|tara:strand:- start:38874 stop:39344 length:471 start_codon:yes stop_codon:yes gene_type:complete
MTPTLQSLIDEESSQHAINKFSDGTIVYILPNILIEENKQALITLKEEKHYERFVDKSINSTLRNIEYRRLRQRVLTEQQHYERFVNKSINSILNNLKYLIVYQQEQEKEFTDEDFAEKFVHSETEKAMGGLKYRLSGRKAKRGYERRKEEKMCFR